MTSCAVVAVHSEVGSSAAKWGFAARFQLRGLCLLFRDPGGAPWMRGEITRWIDMRRGRASSCFGEASLGVSSLRSEPASVYRPAGGSRLAYT